MIFINYRITDSLDLVERRDADLTKHFVGQAGFHDKNRFRGGPPFKLCGRLNKLVPKLKEPLNPGEAYLTASDNSERGILQRLITRFGVISLFGGASAKKFRKCLANQVLSTGTFS